MSKTLVVDVNAIPKTWEVEEFLKAIEETGIIWIDQCKEGLIFKHPPVSVVDLDDIEDIEFLQNINIDELEIKSIEEAK